ncbi:MAG TPA: aldo/keto reductase [Streptosporangiaceae bacterium]
MNHGVAGRADDRGFGYRQARQAKWPARPPRLAWLIGADVPMIPLVGASSVAQLDESLAAVDLELTAEQRARLDAAS